MLCQNRRAVRKHEDWILRIGKCARLLFEQAQIRLDVGKTPALFQGEQVGLPHRVQLFLLSRLEIPAELRRFRVVHGEFVRRRDVYRCDVAAKGTLRIRVKRTDTFNLLVKKGNAQRLRRPRGKDLDHFPAAGYLPRALDERGILVPRPGKAVQQFLRRGGLPFAQRDILRKEMFRRAHPGKQRLYGCEHDTTLLVQPVERLHAGMPHLGALRLHGAEFRLRRGEQDALRIDIRLRRTPRVVLARKDIKDVAPRLFAEQVQQMRPHLRRHANKRAGIFPPHARYKLL